MSIAPLPDLRDRATRTRLSASGMQGFFAIADRWKLTTEQQADLLGGLSRESVARLRVGAGTRSMDELTRVSLIVGIYEALHAAFGSEDADRWVHLPNTNPLFGGQTPLSFMTCVGIPAMTSTRHLVEDFA